MARCSWVSLIALLLAPGLLVAQQGLPTPIPLGDAAPPFRLPPVPAIAQREPVPAPLPELQPVAEPEFDVEPMVDEVICSPWECWSGSVEFGLSGTDGNAETLSMRLGANAKYESGPWTHTFELVHNQSKSDGEITANNLLLDVRAERVLGDSIWTWFGHMANEYDEFKQFDSRVSADTGLGCQLIDSDRTSLIARLGASSSREVGGVDDDYIPEMTAGAEWTHQISERQKLAASLEYFPNVTDFDDYRLNSKASWEVVVDPVWGLSLKLSAIDRYDSTPNGALHNDLDYAALLMWSF